MGRNRLPHPLAGGRPLISQSERDHVEAMIDKAADKVLTARELARSYELAEAVERIQWALDFLYAATEKVRGAR